MTTKISTSHAHYLPGIRISGRLTCALVAAIFALFLCNPALAAPFAFDDTGWEGLTGFDRILADVAGEGNVAPSYVLDWSTLKPADAVVIIHPTTLPNIEDLAAFLDAGGRVALLDDYGVGDEIMARFRISRVPAPSHPARMLRSNPSLAIAEPVSDSSSDHAGSLSPVVAHVNEIVTNHPTGLEHPSLPAILRIRAQDGPGVAIGLVAKVGLGRLIVISDPSIMTNQMLRYPGNRELASALGRYLAQDDKAASRGGQIRIVANEFQEKGAFGEHDFFAHEAGAAVAAVKAWVSTAHRQGVSATVAFAVALLSASGTLAWLLWRVSQPYSHFSPRFTRGSPLAAQGGVAGRAALLSSPRTHRALALLELRSALLDALSAELRLPHTVSDAELLERLAESQRLTESQMSGLRKLLLLMSEAETSVAAARPIRIRQSDIRSAATALDQLLRAMQHRPENQTSDAQGQT